MSISWAWRRLRCRAAQGVNRAFVRAALAAFFAKRPGLAALAAIAKIAAPFTPYHFGFVFGPRINAGGRVGRCSLGVELLTAASDADAMPLALMLDRHNRERQAIESVILEEAMAKPPRSTTRRSCCIRRRLAFRRRRHHRRAIEGAFRQARASSSASKTAWAAVRRVRSPASISARLSARRTSRDCSNPAAATRWPRASRSMAGMLEPFQAFLAAQFANADGALDAANDLVLDCVISASGATLGWPRRSPGSGPFGAGNPEPLAVASDVRVAFADVVGKKPCPRAARGADGGRLGAIAFRAADTALGEGLLHSRGAPLHVAGYLRADELERPAPGPVSGGRCGPGRG
jgi:single-stranded-DNA-specific exonuclease